MGRDGKRVYWIFSLIYFALGVSGAFGMDGVLYYLYVSGVGALQGALYMSVAFLPWALKPVVGFYQDRGGGKYRFWVFLGVFLIWLALAGFVHGESPSYWLFVGLIFVCNLGRMVADVAVDGWAVSITSGRQAVTNRSLMEASGFLGGIVGFPLVILLLGDDLSRWTTLVIGAIGIVLVIGYVVPSFLWRGIPEGRGVVRIDWSTLRGWIWRNRRYFVLGFISSFTFAIGKVLGLRWLLWLEYGPREIAVFMIANLVFSAGGALLARKSMGTALWEPATLVLRAVMLLTVAYVLLGLAGDLWGVQWALIWLIGFTGFADGFFIGAIGILFTKVGQDGTGGPATKFSCLIASTNLSMVIFSAMVGFLAENFSYQMIWCAAGIVPLVLVVLVFSGEDPASREV